MGKSYLKYVVFLCFFLCGCATYNIKEEKNGFAFTRYNKLIPEYTVGAEESFPDKELAEERFKRRRKSVEYYYKKMGFIDNRFKQDFIEPPVTFVKFLFGILRVPFIMISDYKYNHNLQYKERVDKLEDQRYEAERAHIKGLKEELASYIKEDLAKEPYLNSALSFKDKKIKGKNTESKLIVPKKIGPKEVKPKITAPKVTTAQEPKPMESSTLLLEVKPDDVSLARPAIKDEAKLSKDLPKASLVKPVAVIIAKPQSGSSPLKVNFFGSKSKPANGRIVSYEWDFGDGDKSNKPNPINTYWSTTYGIREYTATLTVTDNFGASSSSSIIIQVVNK